MTSAADPTQVEKEYLAGMAEDVPTSRELEKDSKDVAEEARCGRGMAACCSAGTAARCGVRQSCRRSAVSPPALQVFAGRELDRERGTKSTETPPGTAGPPK